MPKIIRILEILEILVTKRQEENEQIIHLNAEIQSLQAESKVKDSKQAEVRHDFNVLCHHYYQLFFNLFINDREERQ